MVHHKGGQQILQTLMKDFEGDNNSKFSSEQGFEIAYSIINESLDLEPLDPSIGELKIGAWEWGYNDNDEYYENWKWLDTHVCTE